MVDVAMRQQDLLQRQPFALNRLEQALDLATRVDQGRLAGVGTPQQGAVLLKRGDGKNPVLQDTSLQTVHSSARSGR